MKSKEALLGLVLFASAIGHSQIGYSQEKVKEHAPGLLESLGKKSWNVMQNAAKSGANYVERKYHEMRLEDQIQNRMSYDIPDSVSKGLASYLGLKQGVSADVTSVHGNSATADVHYSYDLDGLEFVEQYEFSIKGNDIDSLASKGSRWTEINGQKYSQDEGFRILHLYDNVIGEWDKVRAEHEKKLPGDTFLYQRKSVNVIGNRATVEVEYRALDKFKNVRDRKVMNTAVEYVFSDGKWKYYDTNFFSAEKNPRQDEASLVKIIMETGSEGLKQIRKWWRGE